MPEWMRMNRGTCPICNGSRKDCRQSLSTGLVFCRDTSANPTNYIYRGEDVWGFSMWQSAEDAAAFAEETQAERDRLRLEYERKRQREIEERIARELDALNRDKCYREILEQLELSEEDRQRLLKRGFTQEQIDRDNYKSIKPWHQVTGKFPANLPGLTLGNCINCHADATLCPVINKDGLIIGFQIRLNNVKPHEGRYRWLTSNTKKNPQGSTPHLKGELPIGMFEPEDQNTPQERIWLTEGTTIKPSLTRYKLNIPVIGAASGRFNGSPTASATAVEYLSAKYQTKTLTFAVDAGDIINRSGVPQRWLEQVKFFTKLGYKCEIAWWGQVTKDECDIDELQDFSAIAFITPEEFSALIQEHKTTHQSSKATRENPPNRPKKDWDWEQWVESRKFTPDIVVKQEQFQFPENLPTYKVIISVKSGLGTGKTAALIQQIQQSSKGCHIIGYRNNLLFQTISRGEAENVTIYHLRQDDGYSLIADEYTHQAYCLDSIAYLENHFETRDLFLDETISVLIHALNGGTLNENQAKAIRILTDAIRQCNRVFLLDANNSDLYTNFIASLAPDKQLIKIENTYQIRPHKIKFVDSINIEGEIKKHDRSPLIKMLTSPDTTPWIVSDCKERTKVLAKILTDAGKKGIVINSETSHEPWAKAFLENPDQYIELTKPQFVIISPSAESGISVTIQNYFTDKFSFFSGVLGTNSQMQIMLRLRDSTIPNYIFCPEKSLVRDRSKPGTYNLKKYQEIMNSRVFQSSLLAVQSANNQPSALQLIGNAIASQQDEWWEMSARCDILDNYEMDHLRECLQYALEEAGHDVEVLQLEQDLSFKKMESEAKEFIRREFSQELFVAKGFDSVEAAKKAARSNGDRLTQRRVEKTYLMDRLPGIEESNLWGADFIYHCYVSDREFIRQLERFWLVDNFDVSQKRHEARWFYEVTQKDFYSARVTMMSHDVIWGLRELGILDFVGQEYHKDSPIVVDFVNKLRQRADIQIALRIDQLPKETLEGEERIKILGRILDLVGYKNQATGKKSVDSSRLNHYQCVLTTSTTRKLGENEFDLDAARVEILECIGKRFWGWINSEKSDIDWESASQKTSTQQQETTDQSPVTTANNLLLRGAIQLLKTAVNWVQVNLLSQSLIDLAWKYLSPEEDSRLRQMYELAMAKLENA